MRNIDSGQRGITGWDLSPRAHDYVPVGAALGRVNFDLEMKHL